MDWGREITVRIEVPAGSRIKRRPDGSIDYLSPLACPFDYGSVPATLAADGDPQDAMVVGPSAGRGARVIGRLVGVVEVTDAGLRDDKWVVLPVGVALDEGTKRDVERFFRRYLIGKRWLARLRRSVGASVQAIHWMP